MKTVLKVVVVLLAVFGFSQAGFAGKPGVGPDDGKAPGRAAAATKVHIEITFEGQEEQDDPNPHRYTGSVGIWFDKAQGLYRMRIAMTVTRKNKVETREAQFTLNPESCTVWEKKAERIHNARKVELKTPAGQQPKFEQLPGGAREVGAVMVPFVDATFGYKRLKSEAVMEKADSPLTDRDDLRWHQVKKKEDDKGELVKRLGLYNDASIWLGISADTDWPVKYVVRGKRGETITFTVTKTNTNPDLKGVFDLPAEVKAELEKGQEKLPKD